MKRLSEKEEAIIKVVWKLKKNICEGCKGRVTGPEAAY